MSMARFKALMDLHWSLPTGPVKCAALEEAVRIADSLNHPEAAFNARSRLVEAATFGGAAEKALTAFAWCLAQCDQHPDQWDDRDLLWKYKWVLGSLHQFPQISKERICQLEDDFEARLKKHNYSLRPVHDLRCSNRRLFGDHEASQRYGKLWVKSKRDSMADCDACEERSLIRLARSNDDHEQAVRHAQDIFDKGLGCRTVPHTVHNAILIPLIKLGRLDDAAEHHRIGYGMVRRDRDMLDDITEHLEYLAIQPNTRRGIEIFMRHLPWAVETYELRQRADYYLAGSLILELAGKRLRKLLIPDSLTCHDPSNSYRPIELSHWFRDEGLRLAKLFDQRNGNEVVSSWYGELRALAGMET